MVTCTLGNQKYSVDFISGRALREMEPASKMYGRMVRLAKAATEGENVDGEQITVTEALAAFQASLGQAVQHTTLRGRLEKMKQHGWILDTGEKNQPKMGRPQNLLEHRPQAAGGFIFDRSVLS